MSNNSEVVYDHGGNDEGSPPLDGQMFAEGLFSRLGRSARINPLRAGSISPPFSPVMAVSPLRIFTAQGFLCPFGVSPQRLDRGTLVPLLVELLPSSRMSFTNWSTTKSTGDSRGGW